MKVGFYNPTHQGFKYSQTGQGQQNPYPYGSLAHSEFELGARRQQGGATWDGEKPGANAGRRKKRKISRMIGVVAN